jgi:hypothetical protein
MTAAAIGRRIFAGYGFLSLSICPPVYFANMKTMINRLLCFCFCIIAVHVSAQNPDYKISDLKFMSGKWTTSSDWGDMEENWSEPMGDNMMCSYRCVKNGKIVFYEFIVIEQQTKGPVMKLRHFSPGNIGWEEKDKPYEYNLIFLDDNVARFERPDKKTSLTFERQSADKLKVTLDRQDKDGKWVQDEFNYTAAK